MYGLTTDPLWYCIFRAPVPVLAARAFVWAATYRVRRPFQAFRQEYDRQQVKEPGPMPLDGEICSRIWFPTSTYISAPGVPDQCHDLIQLIGHISVFILCSDDWLGTQ